MSGKGFTVKKDWDNPIDHAMPEAARVPAELRIGGVQVAPATVLAPMVGVTDTVFRRFIRHASLFTTNSANTASLVFLAFLLAKATAGAGVHTH